MAFIAPSPIFKSVYAGSPTISHGSSQPVYPPTEGEFWLQANIQSNLGNQPLNTVSVLPKSSVGRVCEQFVSSYYGRVYVTPVTISLGNLLGDQTREVRVWNAHLVPKLNSDLTITGDVTGITLTEPEAVPTTFGPLETRTYTLDFTSNGPASILAIYTWEFPGESPTLTVTGNRAIIFAFPPDWSDEVTEVYQWLTQIIESEEGFEDRYRLRQVPRRSLEYRVLMDKTEKRWLERYLWTWKARVFAVPVWQDCTPVTSNVVLGATFLNVGTTEYKSFRAGGTAILTDAYNNSEAVEIQNVNATTLDLVRPTIKAWPAGTPVYPALAGRLDEQVSISQPTADIDFGNVRFAFIDNNALTAVDAPTAYQDGFVLEKAPNRADDLELNWQSKYGLVDFGAGQPFVDERTAFPDQVTRLTFAEGDRESIWFWKEWLHARAGKWSKFYMPSWSVDFTVVSSIAFNDVGLEVEDTEYRNFYNLDIQKRDIAIYTTDGQIYYRRIVAAEEKLPLNSGIEVLTLDAQLGITYTPAEIIKVSFLHPVRLDSDSIQFDWDHVNMARLNFNTRTIPQ